MHLCSGGKLWATRYKVVQKKIQLSLLKSRDRIRVLVAKARCYAFGPALNPMDPWKHSHPHPYKEPTHLTLGRQQGNLFLIFTASAGWLRW